jgi:hypothetical protein
MQASSIPIWICPCAFRPRRGRRPRSVHPEAGRQQPSAVRGHGCAPINHRTHVAISTGCLRCGGERANGPRAQPVPAPESLADPLSRRSLVTPSRCESSVASVLLSLEQLRCMDVIAIEVRFVNDAELPCGEIDHGQAGTLLIKGNRRAIRPRLERRASRAGVAGQGFARPRMPGE